MAEEETTMTDTESVDTGIDQGAMEGDYLSTYGLIDDDGNAIEDQNVLEDGKQPQAPQQPAQPDKTKVDDKGGKQQAVDISKDFYNEDGTLNFERAVSLFRQDKQPQTPQQPVQPGPIQAQPIQQQQPQQPQQPQETADPFEQMRQNYVAAIGLARQYIKNGADPETAMLQAERDVESYLREHYMKSEFSRMQSENQKSLDSLKKEIEEERETVRAEPAALKNLMAACAKNAPGMAAETLRDAIFNKDIGGQFLIDLFSVSNPDKEKLEGEPLQKAMNDWFIRTAAKNPRFVDSLARNVVNQIQAKVLPDLIKLSQQSAAERGALQQRTKPGPKSPQNPAAHKPNTPDASNDLDVFFHRVPRGTDGRPHI